MLKFLKSRENIPLLVAGAVALAALFVWLSPDEATLGQAVKMVYVHAALMWVGLGLLTLSGAAAVLSLALGSDTFAKWSYGFVLTGMTLVLITGILGTLTAYITWGGIFWGEPRLAMLAEILLAGAIAIIVGKLTESRAVVCVADLSLCVAAWALIIRTELVVHPANPIFTSESSAIKVFPLLITGAFAFAAFQIARYWVSGYDNFKISN